MAETESINILEIYRQELLGIHPCSEEEQRELPKRMLDGDLNAASRLIEGNLGLVLDLAEKFCSFAEESGNLGEFIQEGNMALTMAVYDYTAENGDFDTYIKKTVIHALGLAKEQEEAEKANAGEIASKVNLVSEASAIMARDLGRTPTSAEIAEKLSISEDEVEAAMKLAMDAMTEDVEIPSEEAEEDGQ